MIEQLPKQPRRAQRPDPNEIRAACPYCGDDVVSEIFYKPGVGYVIVWSCWNAMDETPTCSYRRIL